MADLGAIARTIGNFTVLEYLTVRHLDPRNIPNYWGGRSDLSSGQGVFMNTIYCDTDTSGSISGVVQENGTPLASVWVCLYNRITGCLIAKVLSAANGTFVFSPTNTTPVGNLLVRIGLNKNTDDYFVLALDPAGGVKYNIARDDRVIPV